MHEFKRIISSFIRTEDHMMHFVYKSLIEPFNFPNALEFYNQKNYGDISEEMSKKWKYKMNRKLMARGTRRSRV